MRSFIGSSELNVIMSSEARFKFRDNDRGMIELQPNTSIIDNYQFI